MAAAPEHPLSFQRMQAGKISARSEFVTLVRASMNSFVSESMNLFPTAPLGGL